MTAETAFDGDGNVRCATAVADMQSKLNGGTHTSNENQRKQSLQQKHTINRNIPSGFSLSKRSVRADHALGNHCTTTLRDMNLTTNGRTMLLQQREIAVSRSLKLRFLSRNVILFDEIAIFLSHDHRCPCHTSKVAPTFVSVECVAMS
jgi:hypothetical protein